MSRVVDVYGASGERVARHVESWGSGRIEVRDLPGGGIEVVAIHETKDVRSFGGEVTRPGSTREEVLGIYPPDHSVR